VYTAKIQLREDEMRELSSADLTIPRCCDVLQSTERTGLNL